MATRQRRGGRELPASDQRVTGQRVALVGATIGFAGAGGAVIYAFVTRDPTRTLGLDSVVLLVASFVTVTILLYLGSLVLRALDMGAPTQALGMPEGSVRALIAMSLILIFAVIGVLVFKEGTTGELSESSGVTQAQIDQLRAGGAVVIEQDLQPPAPGASPGAEPLYVVRSRAGLPKDAHDFGLQLLSTVSTLVVAVAGFYFGARSVSQAVTASRHAEDGGEDEDRDAPPVSPAEPAADVIPAEPEPDGALATADELPSAGPAPEVVDGLEGPAAEAPPR